MSARLNAKIINITPNLASFATPYSAGDVLDGVKTITNAVINDGGAAKLESLSILDKANQKASIDLLFFSQAPANSVGADNAAYALNDADLAYLIGRVSVLNTDYVSSGTNNAEATIKNIQMIVQAIAGSKNIYVLAVTRGTPTYGAASDLIIRLGFQQF